LHHSIRQTVRESLSAVRGRKTHFFGHPTGKGKGISFAGRLLFLNNSLFLKKKETMTEFTRYTLPALLEKTVTRHAQRPALAFVGEQPLTYADFYQRVKAVSALLEKAGVQPGDRVAILSANMPHWGVTYFGIVSMGAVVVPLLPDFSTEEIKNILRHSRTSVLFVSKGLQSKIKSANIHSLNFKFSIEDFSLLEGTSEVIFDEKATPQNHPDIGEDDLAAIIYTSGTTGKSKGVMLTHKNISFNAIQGRTIQKITPKDRFLSVLPLSHAYENTIGFILPLINGACIYYLKRAPSPSVLVPALQKVKPTMMLTVPLIIEKIYRSRILPGLMEKKMVRKLYEKPFFRKKLNRMAGKKLLKTFGGKLKFFGIGGAKLNEQTEKFLLEARFPYAVGYGLTETAPLLAAFGTKNQRLQSAGKVLEGVEIKIHNPDKTTGEGEILARGPNVMKGYYREPELTAQVLTEDGWFHTGDLGIFDKDGYLYIRGRSKNVILGPSGENIYPEEIESVINNFKHVVESLVIEQKGKLVALVHFDKEEIEKKYNEIKDGVSDYVEKTYNELAADLKEYINSRVSHFTKVHQIIPQNEEFIKTATKKIKRFLYNEKMTEENGEQL
jgi:long-chain acyl-CoA synthetase